MKAMVIIIGIIVGALLGHLIGLLLGLGALGVPALGPLTAAGSVGTSTGTAALGAVGGALLGGLATLGLTLSRRPRSSGRKD